MLPHAVGLKDITEGWGITRAVDSRKWTVVHHRRCPPPKDMEAVVPLLLCTPISQVWEVAHPFLESALATGPQGEHQGEVLT